MDADSVHDHGDSTPTPAAAPSTPPAQASASTAPAQPTQPEAAPVAEQKPTEARPETEKPHQDPNNSAGVIILEWLTYAFWGWLILGLTWLMSLILINTILGDSVNGAIPYAIASSVVLLPIAFLCDKFYRKHEPVKKVGSAMVIMVVHAVLFALLGIVTLIAAVIVGINMAINADGDTNGQLVAMLTLLFAAFLYAGAFLRTLNPFKPKVLSLTYSIFMLVLALVLLGLTAAGPLITSIVTRDDRRLEQTLPSVQSSINLYISENDKLPASLDDVTFSDEESKALVNEGKVEYIPEGVAQKALRLEDLSNTYRYQLCVEYKAAGENRYYRFNSGYTSNLSTYDTSNHEAGRTCYKLEETVYSKLNVQTFKLETN